MRAVVALGGNALLRRGEELSAENQRNNVKIAAKALAPLVGKYQLVITHGNGPQVDFYHFSRLLILMLKSIL